MLINLSNHPHQRWAAYQVEEAKKRYIQILDLAFPPIDPNWSIEEVIHLAEEYLHHCQALLHPTQTNAVHLMGEMTFTATLSQLLLKNDIPCIASTSQRLSIEHPDGSRTMRFEFVRFRNYTHL